MTDRLPSDHDAVTGHRVHLETVGRTGRPRVPLPPAVEAADGDTVRLSLEGEGFHARVTADLEGALGIEGAYANARLARTGKGENALRAWLDSAGIEPGAALVFDVVTPGYGYGLRRPGERVTYRAVDPPSGSLADIAEGLDG